jgi:hypothetical protein
MSKFSRAAAYHNDLEIELRRMVDNGQINQIIERFLRNASHQETP